jgi:hypothetical protein
MSIITISTGQSTTVKSAQSKKCRLLQKVALHTVHVKVAIAIMHADQLLSTVMTELDVHNAALGLRPLRTRNDLQTLTIDLDD